jgi:hypothetical protein
MASAAARTGEKTGETTGETGETTAGTVADPTGPNRRPALRQGWSALGDWPWWLEHEPRAS